MIRKAVPAVLAIALMAGVAQGQQEAAPKPKAEAGEAQKAKVLAAGDAAPAISIAEWVKGDAITGFEKGRVYVVEFWATWCGPCIASMPHLTELQKQYKDRGVTIVGVTSKDPSNGLEDVKKMVTEKGEVIGYSVAWDDEGKTNAAYMKAAKQRGIPCSFVVDGKGNIAYIGHPMGLDPVLERVVAGNWDYVEGPKMLRAINERQREIMKLAQTEPSEALGKLNALTAEFPHLNKSLGDTKYALLVATGDQKGASEMGNKLVDAAIAKKDSGTLNEIAWGIVDPEADVKSRDLELAMRAATEADKLKPNDAAIMDTLARCYWRKGDKAKAVEIQKKAVGLATGQMKEELESVLNEYEASARN